MEILKNCTFKVINDNPFTIDAYLNGKRIGVTIETNRKPDFMSEKVWESLQYPESDSV